MASAAFSSNSALLKSSVAARGRTSRLVSVKTHKSSLAVERFQSIPSNLTPLISRRRGFESRCLSSPGAAQVEPPPEEDREEKEEENVDMVSAIPLVEGFYNSINTRNVEALSEFLAENCVLNDLQFPKAFEGRQVVLKFFEDLTEAMGKGMRFKIDDKSEGEAFTVAVLWHLEWEGKALPFTKGCSFYRCEKEGDRLLIRYVQGFIEPPIKPGEMVLQILKMVSSLFEQFPLIAKSIL